MSVAVTLFVEDWNVLCFHRLLFILFAHPDAPSSTGLEHRAEFAAGAALGAAEKAPEAAATAAAGVQAGAQRALTAAEKAAAQAAEAGREAAEVGVLLVCGFAWMLV